MTHDTYKVVNIVTKGMNQLISYLINDKGVYRKAPTTPHMSKNLYLVRFYTTFVIN